MIAVFLKETIILLRSRKAFWLLLVSVMLAGLILGLQWAGINDNGSFINRRASLGREFFMFLSSVQLCMMGLISPLMSATSITFERESKTFELLLCSRLGRLHILLGKWLAAIFFQVMIALLMLPIMALVFQFGGVGLDEYLFSAVMIVLTVTTYGMMGLAVSCKARKSRSALMRTLALLLLLVFGIPLALLMFSLGALGSGSLFSSPLLIWIYHLEPFMPSAASFLTSSAFLTHLLFQSILFLIALRVALKRLGRPLEEWVMPLDYLVPMIPDPEPPPPEATPPGPPPLQMQFIQALIRETPDPEQPPLPGEAPVEPAEDPGLPPPPAWRPVSLKEIGDNQNPIQFKEFNVWMGGNSNSVMVMIMIFILISLILIIPATSVGAETYIPLMGIILSLLLGFVLPLLSASAISREREENTMDLLRTLPYTPLQIVQGKFFAIFRIAMILLAALAGIPSVFRMLLALGGTREGRLLPGTTGLPGLIMNFFAPTVLVALPLLAFSALVIALGLFFSSTQRRGNAALLQTFLCLGVFPFLPVSLVNPFAYFISEIRNDDSLLGLIAYNQFHSLLISLLGAGVHAAMVTGIVILLLHAAAWRIAREKE